MLLRTCATSQCESQVGQRMKEARSSSTLTVPLLRRQRPILRSLFFLFLATLFMKSGLPMTRSHSS